MAKVTKKVTKNHGQVPVVWDLKVQGNLLRMQHRWLQRLLQKQR